MKLEFSRQILEKHKNIRLTPSGSRVVLRGRTDGHIDTTKLTVAFRNFAKAPKNQEIKEAVQKSVDMSLLRHMTGMWLTKHNVQTTPSP